MLVFDELQEMDEKWLEWYGREISSYPMGDFSILDPSFNMKTCVDIGASIGGFSIVASNYFEKVLAFEPSRASFTTALQNCHANIDLYNVAVSNRTGDVVDLTCQVCPTTGKFHGHNASIVWGLGDEKERAITIDLEKIYELADTDFIDYLKVDCEGSEWDILLYQDLSRVGLICAEIHGPPKGKGNFKTLRTKLIGQMRADGFEVCLYSENNFFARNTKFNIPCLVCDKEKLRKIQTKASLKCNCRSCQKKREIENA
tara:strand:- start:25105 stop:25878 length:774 start_codon:yes stop_codon:yes gene_type:complete